MKARIYISALAIFFGGAALGAEKQQPVKTPEPKIECEIDSDFQNGKMREATPREAGRKAAQLWRGTQNADLNKNLRFYWIHQFESCLEASGRDFSEIVTSKKRFKDAIVRTFESKVQLLEADAEREDVKASLEAFRDSISAAKKFFPEEDWQKYYPGKAGADDLLNRNNAFISKEKLDCTTKDFSARLGMVRNQTDIGWCYAFTAADLVTFKVGFNTSRFTRRVSAADMAFSYNFEEMTKEAKEEGLTGSDLEGGYTYKSLQHALKHGGFCQEKYSPSEDFAFGSLKETIQDIEIAQREAKRADLSDEQTCFAYTRMKELFPLVTIDDFVKILNRVGESNLDYLKKLTEKNCRNQRQNYGLKPENFHHLDVADVDVSKLISTIDQQLDENNITGIGIKSKVLGDRFNGGHAMTVVGRKLDEKGKCQYLVRNSWGPGCSASIRKEICAKDHTGHVWLSREDLTKNLNRTDYIK